MAPSELLSKMLEQMPEESRNPHELGRVAAHVGVTLDEIGIRNYPCCGKTGSCNHGIVPIESGTPSRLWNSTDGIEDFVDGYFEALEEGTE